MPEENQAVIGNIQAVSEGDNFGIKSTESPFAESFYFEDIYDDKAVKRFIKSVEKMIRSSREYKTYIELLRTNVHELNHDNILHNITTGDVELEFHHYPLSLYDIVEIRTLSHVIRGEKFSSFSLAKDVMEDHYKHIIGLVPLTHTMHELAHSGNLFISSSQVFGDYRKFAMTYSDGLSNDMNVKIIQMETLSANNVPSDFKGVIR